MTHNIPYKWTAVDFSLGTSERQTCIKDILRCGIVKDHFIYCTISQLAYLQCRAYTHPPCHIYNVEPIPSYHVISTM